MPKIIYHSNSTKKYVEIPECPACGRTHIVPTMNDQPKWRFNGSLNRPSLHPSVRNRLKSGSELVFQCHFTLTDGVMHFYGDCTHEHGNEDIELPELKDTDE